jgi:hypothetical protein
MQMKFKIGDPVWSVGHCTKKWNAAVIVGFYGTELKCSICGSERTESVVYAVDNCDGSPGPGDWPHWASGESRTFPRDPDQFKAAEEDFVLRLNDKAPIKGP